MRDSNASAVPASVEIHIEELVLHGFAADDRHHIGAAIEQELSRLVMQHGIEALSGVSANLDRLDAGSLRLAGNAKPQTVGQRVAQQVFHQLSPMSISRATRQTKEARSKP